MKINLLSPKKKIVVPVFLLISGMVLILWHLVLKREIMTVNKGNERWQQELNFLITSINDVNRQQQSVSPQKNNFVHLEQKRSALIRALTTLNQSVLSGIYFTQLIFKNLELKINGQLGSMEELRQFIANLAATYDGTHLPIIQKITKETDNYSFTLSWLGL